MTPEAGTTLLVSGCAAKEQAANTQARAVLMREIELMILKSSFNE